MPKIKEEDILCVYIGEPERCRCGCSGEYYYLRANRKLAGKDRGYKIRNEEINDKQVKRVFNLFQKNSPLSSIEIIDNYIYTMKKGYTEYSIYKIKRR